ncbi:hypothetical protein D187_005240 [Cystobacter fuscus DSM 2262]|uniref:Uncharacterized protein n=1 Tax=Cystobacter fuscus (strain ATCC 25194 / DSM 2262 / NBRC 100088 / M29) TaxID=1242864 RepID=S9PNU6_CYSF2|nr:hypothetical protein [Cystobacter fuscus]EPX64107.1 hypothetical protein D187_005240 [Cystobacter fuscus DSM 2262]
MDAGHLASRVVTLCRCLVDAREAPSVEDENQRIALHPVDPVRNSRRERPWRRPHLDETAPRHPAFDPPRALLDKTVGRPPAHATDEDGGEA